MPVSGESSNFFVTQVVDVSRSTSFPDLDNVASSTALILCSSGTSGLPKGVCKSHSQIITQIFLNWALKSKKQEVLLNFSNFYWESGIIFLVVGSLYGGKRIITTKPFSAELITELCNHYEVTSTFAAPSALASLLHMKKPEPLTTVEYFLVGGSVVSKKLCESIKPRLLRGEICAVYGMTEVDLATDSFKYQRYGSVGTVAPNVRVKIIDEAGRSLGPNQQGEVCFQTPVKFLGYFADPEKTAEAFIGDWVLSGDVGYFDDDGFLFIIDRKKDMLKFNNYQV